MFPNLSASRKLLVLCAVFIVAVGVTTYSLVAEKYIAIEFAKKELVGSRYLAAVRKAYGALLVASDDGDASAALERVVRALNAAESDAGRRLQTAQLEQGLTEAVRNLETSPPSSANTLRLEALDKARVLAVRIGDDSNLTLDPDLDTYYLQNIIVNSLPDILGRLGKLHDWTSQGAASQLDREDFLTRGLVLGSLLRSDVSRVEENLERAYRGNTDGQLKPEIHATFAAMVQSIGTYLDETGAQLSGPSGLVRAGAPAPNVTRAVDSTLDAWAAAQSELNRLLNRRIDGHFGGLEFSLILTGALAALSIFVAMLTYRHFVIPLERLEATARQISDSRDYDVRMQEASGDEIGALAKAFNDMLGELAASREREITEHQELAQVQRMTTLGAMTASVAHEINQPLAAIVTNSNAATRWLNRAEPDLDEARSALKRIVDDGHRASQVIASIRGAFKKDGQNRVSVPVNELVIDALRLGRGRLRKHEISVETNLAYGLPQVIVDRIQMQQVLLNLITNAADAMVPVNFRPRVLRISTEPNPDEPTGALITVTDTGTGIAKSDHEKIFDALYTTKTSGMGMGLFICKSIVESHGGRLWAMPNQPFGTSFCLALPAGAADVSE